MANTTFTGPVISNNGFVFPVATAAELGDIADPINVLNKTLGKSAVDIATGVIYTSTGTADDSDWKGSDATSITPA